MASLLNGVYRARVATAADPEERMRVRLIVPQVLGDAQSDWALPAFPLGLSQVPPRGTPVWAMFEGGDPLLPVYFGSWLRSGEPAVLGTDSINLDQIPDGSIPPYKLNTTTHILY